jgi:hypothetical protein
MASDRTVDTRMGELRLENGFPFQAELETLYVQMDYKNFFPT